MNHGASASTLAEVPVSLTDAGDQSSAAAIATQGTDHEGLGSIDRAPTKAKLNSLGRLQATLDNLLYLELCAIYYMDNIAMLFFLRIVVQFTYLTPKPASMPLPKHRPYIGSIIGTNLLCILLHLIFAAPSAGELTRGYLHGSLIIDFVGQKGPTSKIRLLATDIVVLALQLLSLCVVVELGREKDKGQSSTLSDVPESNSGGDENTQEQDSVTSRPQNENEDGIELHDIQRNSVERTVAAEDREVLEDDPLMEDQDDLSSSSEEDAHDSSSRHPLDQFYSGQIILANFHIIDTIRNQFWDYRSSGRGEV